MSYSIDEWFDDHLKGKLSKIEDMEAFIELLKESINLSPSLDKTELFRKWLLLAALNPENEDMGKEEMLHQAFSLMQNDGYGDLMQIKYKNRVGDEVSVIYPNHEGIEDG